KSRTCTTIFLPRLRGRCRAKRDGGGAPSTATRSPSPAPQGRTQSSNAPGGAPALPGGDPQRRAGDRKRLSRFRKRAGFRPKTLRRSTRLNPTMAGLDPAIHGLSRDSAVPALGQIVPVRVYLLDQGNLPIPLPSLEICLAADCIGVKRKLLAIDEAGDAILLAELGASTFAMCLHTVQ